MTLCKLVRSWQKANTACKVYRAYTGLLESIRDDIGFSIYLRTGKFPE